jgi:hypothetical protein
MALMIALFAPSVNTALIQPQLPESVVKTVKTALRQVNTTLIIVLLATSAHPTVLPKPLVLTVLSLSAQLLHALIAHQATCAPLLTALLNSVPAELLLLLVNLPVLSALPVVKLAQLLDRALKQTAVMATTEFTLVELSLLTDA